MGSLTLRQLLGASLLVLFLLTILLPNTAEAYICFEPYSVDEPTEGTDTTKGNKKNYQGKGQGKNSNDGGGLSTQNCDTNNPPPPAPGGTGNTSVSPVNSSNGSYTVSWSAASGMITSGIEVWGYELLEYKSGVLQSTYMTSPTTTSYVFSNKPDGNYQYKARGCNHDSYMGTPVCGPYGSLSSTNYVRNKPSTPSIPSVSSTTSTGSVVVNWIKPNGTVTFYRLQKRVNGGSWTWANTNISSTSKSLSGLTDGSWDFRVQACNTYTWACSSFSADSANTTVRLKPSTPAAPTVPSTDADGSYSISWTKPAGSVTEYDVLEYQSGVTGNQVVGANVAATTLSLSGRGDGTYTYRVRACNEFEWACSSYSAHSSGTTVLHVPGAPSSISGPLNLDKDGSFTISWGAASGQVDYYQTAHRQQPIGGTFNSWTYVNRGTALSHNYSGLTDGEWDFAVRACNTSGCSGWRYIEPHVQVLWVPSIPSSITGPSSTDIDGMHTISWGASTGSSITYELQERLKPYGSSTYGSWLTVHNSTSRSKSFTNRDDGDWAYRVRGCNAAGCSAYLTISPVVTVLKVPYAPTGVSVPSTDVDGAYTLSWSSGGGIIDRYEFSESPNFSPWTSVGAATSRVVTGKGDGSWNYRVRACNSSGCGAFGTSNTITVTHPTPAAPASISAPSQTTETRYQISWEASTSTSVDDYEISQQRDTNGWSAWAKKSGTSAEVTVDESGSWTHRVRACNILPDNTRKCSAATTSTSVNVVLPAKWARKGGTVDDQSYGYLEGLISDEGVGALEGEAGVSGGAATYTIPIIIPPGRKGMQPNVSLNYSSRSGNGIVGMGWSVSSGSSIHRCSATYAQDGYTKAVTFEDDDKLCLDGQRLIAISGTYGQPGAKYRTELDSFARVTQSGYINNGATFIVEYKNNRKSHYGKTSDSKHIPEGLTEPLSWAINKQEDPSGNAIHYQYTNLGDGEYVLANIWYTGKNESLGNRQVSFVYANRSDVSMSYTAGGLTKSSQILKQINTLYNGQLIREYKLSHLTSMFSQRSILYSIRECSLGKCLPPTSFSSYNPSLIWDNKDSSSTSNLALNMNGEVQNSDKILRRDLNGDGLSDIIYTSKVADSQSSTGFKFTHSIYKHEFDDTYTLKTTEDSESGLTLASGYYPSGDLNSDGFNDFLVVVDGKVKVIQYNESFERMTFGTNATPPSKVDYLKTHVGDFNGDGYHDFIYTNDIDRKVYYYQNRADGTTNFDGPYLITQKQYYDLNNNRYHENLSYFDVDGDGYTDIIRTFRSGTLTEVINIDFGAINSSGRWYTQESLSATQLGLPTNLMYNQYLWGDLNGDGLSDFIRAEQATGYFYWSVRLNKGDRTFSNIMSLGSSLGLHSQRYSVGDGTTSTYAKNQALWGGVKVADFDNDGKDELFVATHSDDNFCVNFAGRDQETGTYEFKDVKVCNDLLHTSSKVSYDSHPTGGMYIDWGNLDLRRFKWSIIDFKVDNLSLTKSRVFSDVVNAPIQAGIYNPNTGDYGSPLELVDSNNDGYIDFLYKPMTQWVYSGNTTIAGKQWYDTIISAQFEAGNAPIVSGYFEQKSLIGEGVDEGKLADVVERVINGFGNKTEWAYSHLSSGLVRNNGTFFYFVPDLVNRYVTSINERQYFNFNSSMYVVSSSTQSNGINENGNKTEYNYREAVYNRSGRGFQGFRTIIIDDKESGTRSVSDFHQIFPKAGKIEEVRTCLTDDSLFECQGSPLSKTVVTSYHDKNTAPNVYWVYPAETIKEQYDLNNRTELLNREETTIGNTAIDVDIFGNVLKSVTLRNNGYQETKIETTKLFDVDENSWWINKLLSQKTTTTTTSPNTRTGVPVAIGSDPVQFTEMNYAYINGGDIHRTPTQIITNASGTTQSHTTTMSLNTYGLPTTVTQSGSGSASSDLDRTVSTTYSSDGYFPYEVTNDLGHKTSTDINPKHGQPDWVKDANNNIVNYTYDAFGRVKSSTVPGGKTIQSGYKWCPGYCANAPATAEYMEFTKQEGSPTVKTYKDMFNRTVMVETMGFDGSSIYTSVEYDELGRKTFESIPALYSPSLKGTHYTGFDELGRLVSKETDRENNNTYSTSYSHTGHTTSITVVDGGDTLSMSRTYGGDGKLIQTTDALNGVTRYAYDSMGNPITLQDANGNPIHAWHNGFGHKTKVDDPNMGVKTFAYNTFGEVEQEIDANGDKLTMRYDVLGRLKQRLVNDIEQASYTYDSHYKGKGLPATELGTGIDKAFYYDEHSRPKRQVTTIDSTPYETITEYDSNFGRVKAVEYPASDIKVGYAYNQYGYQTKTFNADSGFVYQEVTARDHFLNAVESLKNAGTLAESRNYDSATGQLKSIAASEGSVQKHLLTYDYKSFGNLDYQTVSYENGAKTSTETYWYDKLHRLTRSERSFTGVTHSEAPITYDYDAVGNLEQKSDYASTLSYGGIGKSNAGNAGPNAVLSITKPDNSTANYTYDNNGNMETGDGKTISYNAFNKPISISKGGINSTFAYGADLMRFKQVKTGLPEGDETTIYLDKMVEIVEQGGSTITRTYIDDIAIISKEEIVGQPLANHKIRFTLRDRLGSVVTLTDHNNQIMEHRSYDPFGKPRTGDFMDVAVPTLREAALSDPHSGDVIDNIPFTNRGFTDHEHLDDAELIHMNGRAYDYNLGRFLSVDPFIQEPGNSQSMNPYSYIMNNPLAGTDPTGYYSVGSLGVTDKFCASYKCAVVDKLLAGFTMAGDNGASLSQKRDAAQEAKNQSIIGQIESQGGKADVRYWNGGKVKLSELSYVHTAVSAGTDLSRTPNVLKFASNNARDVIRDYVNQAKIVMAGTIPFGGDPTDPESLGRGVMDVGDFVSPALDTVDELEDGDYSSAAMSAAMVICRGCKVAGKFAPDPVADAVSKAIQEGKKKNIRVEVDGKDFQEQFDEFYKKRRNAKGEVRQPTDPKTGNYKGRTDTIRSKAMELFDNAVEFLNDFF